MNTASEAERDRLEELMAGHVLGDLSGDEAKEMQRLKARHPSVQMASFEDAMTALSLASTHYGFERLPTDLRRVIESDYPKHVTPPARANNEAAGARRRARRPDVPVIYKIGWIAAASCFMVAVYCWWELSQTQPPPFAQFIQRVDVVSPAWAVQADADACFAGVTGQVYWSDATQGGYLKFVGLPANDPAKSQYQLWIVDEARAAEPPIDGGVFDVTESDETIVPFDAALPVAKAKAFAISVEKPGGVVVSVGPMHLVAPI